MPPKTKKRTLRLVRADDDEADDALNVAQARTINLSRDGRRLISSVSTPCARVEPGETAPLNWTTHFIPPPTIPAFHKRRYPNSVCAYIFFENLPGANQEIGPEHA